MEIFTKLYAKKLVEWAKDKPKVLVLSADLTSSTEVDLFKNEYPDRFLSFGLAEQNMIGAAGGLAREGFYPYIHTFAVFIYRRAYDQIIGSVAYPNLPVRMIGFLPGIMTPGGITHQAIEDIAIMRSVPNMTVVEIGDATEIETVLNEIQSVDGPVYVRMLRGEVPRLFPATDGFEINKARILSEGNDISLFTSGICTEEAMRVTEAIKQKGISIQHLHISTHKPFSDPRILEACLKAKHGIVTMENHTIIGGLGTEVAEVLAENGIGKKLIKIGLKDTFAHGASQAYLMREYELDALSLVKNVEQLIGEKLDLEVEDLQSERIQTTHSEAKAEAL